MAGVFRKRSVNFAVLFLAAAVTAAQAGGFLGSANSSSGLKSDTTTADLEMVAALAFAAVGLVVLLDVAGRVADGCVRNHDEREHVERILDAVAALAAYVIASLWFGLLQEYILTSEYATGRFPSASFLVLSGRILTVPIVGLALLAHGRGVHRGGGRWAALSGCLNGSLMYLGETSLLFIPFPVQAAIKSFSIVPMMAVNTAVNGDRQGWKAYVVAIFMGLCFAGFSLANASSGSALHPNAALGVALTCVMVLVMCLAQCTQRNIFNHYADFCVLQMMFVCCTWNCLTTFAIEFFTTGISPLIDFVKENPMCIAHLNVLAVSGAVLSYFIFYILRHQGPVALTIAGVLKTLVNLLLSAFVYGHPLDLQAQLCAVGTIFGIALFAHYSASYETMEGTGGHLRTTLALTSRLHLPANVPAVGSGDFYGAVDKKRPAAGVAFQTTR